MKILYINYTKTDGGGFIHTTEFVKSGRKLGHTVIVYPPLNHDSRQDTLSTQQSTTHSIEPTSGPYSLVSLKKRLRLWLKNHFYDLLFFKSVILKGLLFNFMVEYKEIKKTSPDLVILRAGTYLSSPLGCKLLNVPCLIEINGPLAENRYNTSTGHLRFEKFWSFLLEKIFIKAADKVIVVSEPFRQHYIEKGLQASSIETVPNGVDTKRFLPDHQRKEELKETFQLNGAKIIGFTGNFRPWHGLESLLDAMVQIIQIIPNVKLLVVGDGPEKKSLIQKTQALGLDKHIIFTGQVAHEDMPAMVSVFDVAVAPYAHTNFFYFSPLKVFEYMASGCGIVAPKLGQINQLIEDGASGILYDPRNPQSLIEGICKLLANDSLREKMGNAARKRVQQNFTWRHNAEKIFHICTKITGTTS